jgi:hypothetical protein
MKDDHPQKQPPPSEDEERAGSLFVLFLVGLIVLAAAGAGIWYVGKVVARVGEPGARSVLPFGS